jgi:hypothetical protein
VKKMRVRAEAFEELEVVLSVLWTGGETPGP